MNKIRITSVSNAYGVTMTEVAQKFKCDQWQMSDGLQHAGQ